MRLEEKLDNLPLYPFHMPGHKRNASFCLPSSSIDITEIEGFDNLHSANGIIKSIENELADTFDSKKSLLLVNGSTCGILAGIFALCEENDTIIIARNCHKSVYNACFIRKLNIEYIYEKECEFGCTAIKQEDVDNALKKHPNAKALVITSPTYEGIVSRIKSPIPLIIDAAHGSHFGLAPYLPQKQNADIIINSLHKTLPCLTQTAVLNIYNQKYISKVKEYVDIFETSSPSYILMSSVSRCMNYLKQSKNDFEALKTNLGMIYDTLSHCKNLTYCNKDTNGGNEQDITRISIGSKKNITGDEIANILRQKYNIEVEMATSDYVVLISTVADTKQGFDLLNNAISGIDKMLDKAENKTKSKHSIYHKLKKESEVWQITHTEETLLQNSIGRISGEYIYAYPPGIPIIAPGEVIDKKVIDDIIEMQNNNVNLCSKSNNLTNVILTKAQD